MTNVKDKLKQMSKSDFVIVILRGLFLALAYFTVTKDNDTTLINIVKFAGFYVIVYIAACVVDIDTKVVTTAFITKTIFTLVDERVKLQST
jgi:uncharacterized membrane protein